MYNWSVLSIRCACIVVLSWTHQRLTQKRRNWVKFIIFVFFAHKMYSFSFMKLWLNWFHKEYFTDVLPCYLSGPWMFQFYCCLQKALRFNQNYLHLCSEDKRRSYRFRITWRWVVNDRNFIFSKTFVHDTWCFLMLPATSLDTTRHMVKV